MSFITINVETNAGNCQIQASSERPLFVVGRNGVGKSALVHHIVNRYAGRAIYLPGARPSTFPNEFSSLNPASRKAAETNLSAWDRNPDGRWQGFPRNEKAIYDLTLRETQFKVDAANQISREGKDSSAVAMLQSSMSPLDRTNAVLKQANLPISIVVHEGELKAKRENSIYSIAKMSDGERSALVFIAEAVSAPAGSVFFIDEPELHLHKSIVVPLIAAVMRENAHSTFIVSTHELDLVSVTPHASVAIVRGCSFLGINKIAWDVDVISNADEIPEDVRNDILGSRRKILFIEGAKNSLDAPLYALLFPNVSIRSRDSCREVERVVIGLGATRDTHYAEVYGMVDGDGMSSSQVTELEAKNVHPLPVYSVESLYYCDQILCALAARQADTLGLHAATLLKEAKTKAINVLDASSMSHLAARVAERGMRHQVLQLIPDRKELMNGGTPIHVEVPSPYPGELSRLVALRGSENVAEIIARYPVRESRILDALATGLRFSGREDYERGVLHILSVNESLVQILRDKLGSLASKLASS